MLITPSVPHSAAEAANAMLTAKKKLLAAMLSAYQSSLATLTTTKDATGNAVAPQTIAAAMGGEWLAFARQAPQLKALINDLAPGTINDAVAIDVDWTTLLGGS